MARRGNRGGRQTMGEQFEREEETRNLQRMEERLAQLVNDRMDTITELVTQKLGGQKGSTRQHDHQGLSEKVKTFDYLRYEKLVFDVEGGSEEFVGYADYEEQEPMFDVEGDSEGVLWKAETADYMEYEGEPVFDEECYSEETFEEATEQLQEQPLSLDSETVDSVDGGNIEGGTALGSSPGVVNGNSDVEEEVETFDEVIGVTGTGVPIDESNGSLVDVETTEEGSDVVANGGTHMMKNYAGKVLECHLNFLNIIRPGGNNSSKPSMYRLLRPRLDILRCEVVFPLMCFSGSDQKVWDGDPHEHVREGYDIIESLYSPRTASMEIVSEVVRKRGKENLHKFIQFIVEIFKPYRQKDGALLAVGAPCDKLRQPEPYKSDLQSKWTLEKDPTMDVMHLQGVRFAGGFDAETRYVFGAETRSRVTKTGTPAPCLDHSIEFLQGEELHLVGCIFDDKTLLGTRNLMEFCKCLIAVEVYGSDGIETQIGKTQQNGMKVRRSAQVIHEKGFNFEDARLMHGSWRNEPTPDRDKGLFGTTSVSAARYFSFFYYRHAATMIYVRKSHGGRAGEIRDGCHTNLNALEYNNDESSGKVRSGQVNKLVEMGGLGVYCSSDGDIRHSSNSRSNSVQPEENDADKGLTVDDASNNNEGLLYLANSRSNSIQPGENDAGLAQMNDTNKSHMTDADEGQRNDADKDQNEELQPRESTGTWDSRLKWETKQRESTDDQRESTD